MKPLVWLVGLLAVGMVLVAEPKDCPPLLDLEIRRLASDERINLCEQYRGQVILVVNTASRCGFTPQYDALERLYRTYKDRGLVVLGFPSNNFANQEPGSEREIQDFCRLTYAVEFPMFEKVSVKPGKAAPLFERLAQAGAPYPQWNFFKYLIDRDGRLVAHYPSQTPPDSPQIIQAIEALL
ncbi:glutathione peroxidase [Caldichromatium japonicum]|uniref:Glutathione peroxidase n=1 Tax=Caldichromatium japonicum TaxID=2699430 RepID=A0A6G7VD60_9GAMM|nr:glutathione peroxidase [Caldichromatium japonicum]QIK37840.1 glutathione peroxidase [Caldichromatium japonicum]